MPSSQNSTGKEISVVAVSLDAAALSRDPERVLGVLADGLDVIEGERVILLPPLLPNLMALPQLAKSSTLAKAVGRAARGRWSRRAAVYFTYPHAARRRRPWLVMHDTVHEAPRRGVGGLGLRTKSTIACTVLISHPRTHWEAWPDHGELFHTAWSFGPDAEPYDVIRQPRCRMDLLADAGVDGNETLEVRPLNTPAVAISPAWEVGPPPTAPILWLPQATLSDEGPTLEALLDSGPSALVVARSVLAGSLGGALKGQAELLVRRGGGQGERLCAPLPNDDTPATWAVATVTLPDDYVCEEPTGAP